MVIAAPTVFRVLTEFNFEVGSAIVSSERLGGAIDKVSESADDLLFSFEKLGLGVAVQFLSGPGGGVLGVLAQAAFQSDKLTQSQLQFANIVGRGAGTFAERMEFAALQLEKIDRIARGFALPTKDLVQITKILTPLLKQEFTPSIAFGKATELGRFFLKAAPTLGIDAASATSQLQRAALGQATRGDPLFNILTQDTKTLNEFIGSAKKFNELPFAERVQKLTDAFKEFGSDLSVLDAVTNSLSGQIRILRENLSGMFSVVAPLGKILDRLSTDALVRFNDFLDKILRPTIKNIAFGLEPLLQTSEQLLVNVIQLSKLGENLRLASRILLISASLLGLNFVLGIIGVEIIGVSFLLKGFAALMARIQVLMGGVLLTGAGLTGILGILNGIAVLITSILAPLLLLVFIFQLIARATAIFQINAAKRIAGLMERISEVFAKATRIFAVFLEGFDKLAQLLAVSPVFSVILDGIVAMIEGLSFLIDVIIFAVAGFQGLAFAILSFFDQVKSLVTGGGFEGGKIGEAFDAGAEDIFSRAFGPDGRGASISGNVTNIGKIEIRNDIKEKIEPDRLAFTIVDQLQKIATNPTQAANRKLAVPGVGGNR